jgi:20S proteasome alpha/beta subunit
MNYSSFLCIILAYILNFSSSRESEPSSPATIFGFLTKNGVFLSSTETYSVHGVLKIHSQYPWIHKIGKYQQTLIGLSGDECDCDEFLEQIKKENMKFELMMSSSSSAASSLVSSSGDVDSSKMEGHSLTTQMVANYCRALLWKGNRTRRPQNYNLQLLIGGFESTPPFSPVLFYIDHFGNMKNVKYFALGGEMQLLLSLLDQYQNEFQKCHVSASGLAVNSAEGKEKVGSDITGDPVSGDKIPSTMGHDGKKSGNFVHGELLMTESGTEEERQVGTKIIENCWKIIQKRSMQDLFSSVSRSSTFDNSLPSPTVHVLFRPRLFFRNSKI